MRRRVPDLPPAVPRRPSAARRVLGKALLRLLGWTVEGNLPDLPRFLVIVAPHTSNWDFVIGFAAYLALQLDARWLGKHTLFWWPLGPVLRHFGGIPIVRTKSANVVDLYVAEFQRRTQLVIVVAPEGTRKKVPDWRSGFYHIAAGAGVPIVPVALDFSAKAVRIFAPVRPSGDYAADLTTLKGHYAASMARYPANY